MDPIPNLISKLEINTNFKSDLSSPTSHKPKFSQLLPINIPSSPTSHKLTGKVAETTDLIIKIGILEKKILSGTIFTSPKNVMQYEKQKPSYGIGSSWLDKSNINSSSYELKEHFAISGNLTPQAKKENAFSLGSSIKSQNDVSGKTVLQQVLSDKRDDVLSLKHINSDIPVVISKQFYLDLPRGVYILNDKLISTPNDFKNKNTIEQDVEIFKIATKYTKAFNWNQAKKAFFGLSCIVNQGTLVDMSLKARHMGNFTDTNDKPIVDWDVFVNSVLAVNLNNEYQVQIKNDKININIIVNFKISAGEDLKHKGRLLEVGDDIGYTSISRKVSISIDDLANDWSLTTDLDQVAPSLHVVDSISEILPDPISALNSINAKLFIR